MPKALKLTKKGHVREFYFANNLEDYLISLANDP
jgi:hypothetical protein